MVANSAMPITTHKSAYQNVRICHEKWDSR